MPWTAKEFKERHNKELSPGQAKQASRVANAVLSETGDEGKAIRIANAQMIRKRRGLRRHGMRPGMQRPPGLQRADYREEVECM